MGMGTITSRGCNRVYRPSGCSLVSDLRDAMVVHILCILLTKKEGHDNTDNILIGWYQCPL